MKTDLLPYGAVSRLYIANASQRDAGNYTCAITDSSWTTVMVHILNGKARILFSFSFSAHPLLVYHLSKSFFFKLMNVRRKREEQVFVCSSSKHGRLILRLKNKRIKPVEPINKIIFIGVGPVVLRIRALLHRQAADAQSHSLLRHHQAKRYYLSLLPLLTDFESRMSFSSLFELRVAR